MENIIIMLPINYRINTNLFFTLNFIFSFKMLNQLNRRSINGSCVNIISMMNNRCKKLMWIYDEIPLTFIVAIYEMWIIMKSQFTKYMFEKSKIDLCRQLDCLYQTWERYYTSSEVSETVYSIYNRMELIYIELAFKLGEG